MNPPSPFINLEFFYRLVYDWLTGRGEGGVLGVFLGWYRPAAAVTVVLFWIGIVWLLFKIVKLRKAETEELGRIQAEAAKTPSVKNEAWQRVIGYLGSDNPAEWKMAVIEADKLLEEMVKGLGYEGEDLGERLKKIEPSDFETLQDAWEAHKVRNQIAHEPNFQLTRRQAEEAIARYRRVFEEFSYI